MLWSVGTFHAKKTLWELPWGHCVPFAVLSIDCFPDPKRECTPGTHDGTSLSRSGPICLHIRSKWSGAICLLAATCQGQNRWYDTAYRCQDPYWIYKLIYWLRQVEHLSSSRASSWLLEDQRFQVQLCASTRTVLQLLTTSHWSTEVRLITNISTTTKY